MAQSADRLVWLAMMASSATLTALGTVLHPQATIPSLGTVELALVGVGFSSLVSAFASRALVRGPHATLVGWALADTAAVAGLAATLISGHALFVWILGPAALLVQALHPPGRTSPAS